MNKSYTKTLLLLLLSVLLLPQFVIALSSHSPGNQITVYATGTVHVEADFIDFQITINQFNEDAEAAFEKHKQQEIFLAQVLRNENFADEDITVSPISISSARRQVNEHGYQTNQQVTVRVTDLELFESMQLLFIKNGFTNFSGSFGSFQIESASEDALRLAMAEARKKGDLLAAASNQKIIKTVSIEYGSSPTISGRYQDMAYSAESDGSMLQFKQTVTVQESVKVVYAFN